MMHHEPWSGGAQLAWLLGSLSLSHPEILVAILTELLIVGS